MAQFFRAPDIVHLVVDAVGLMDLSGFEASCKVGHAGAARMDRKLRTKRGRALCRQRGAAVEPCSGR